MNDTKPNGPLTLEGASCVVCKVGTLRVGYHISTFEKEGAVVVVKQVPGWVCDSCGESYDDEEIAERLLEVARDAFARGAEVEAIRFSPSSARAA